MFFLQNILYSIVKLVGLPFTITTLMPIMLCTIVEIPPRSSLHHVCTKSLSLHDDSLLDLDVICMSSPNLEKTKDDALEVI